MDTATVTIEASEDLLSISDQDFYFGEHEIKIGDRTFTTDFASHLAFIAVARADLKFKGSKYEDGIDQYKTDGEVKPHRGSLVASASST